MLGSVTARSGSGSGTRTAPFDGVTGTRKSGFEPVRASALTALNGPVEIVDSSGTACAIRIAKVAQSGMRLSGACSSASCTTFASSAGTHGATCASGGGRSVRIS